MEFMKVQGWPNLEVSKHRCDTCQRATQCREWKPKMRCAKMESALDLLWRLVWPILYFVCSGYEVYLDLKKVILLVIPGSESETLSEYSQTNRSSIWLTIQIVQI